MNLEKKLASLLLAGSLTIASISAQEVPDVYEKPPKMDPLEQIYCRIYEDGYGLEYDTTGDFIGDHMFLYKIRPINESEFQSVLFVWAKDDNGNHMYEASEFRTPYAPKWPELEEFNQPMESARGINNENKHL